MAFFFTFIQLLVNILTLAIVARAILSWVRIDPYHPVVRVLDQVPEPILAPIRRLMPTTSGIDFSPIIAIVLLMVLERLLFALLG